MSKIAHFADYAGAFDQYAEEDPVRAAFALWLVDADPLNESSRYGLDPWAGIRDDLVDLVQLIPDTEEEEAGR